MTLCVDCEKRETCKELCEEAEQYVSQDHVGLKETLFPGGYDEGRAAEPMADIGIEVMSPEHLKELIIGLAHDGKNNCQIAALLPCSRQYVQQVLSKKERNEK